MRVWLWLVTLHRQEQESVRRGLDEASLFSVCEGAKRNKHVLNGATMVPLVVTTFGELSPSARGFLQSLADVACTSGVIYRGSGLKTVLLQSTEAHGKEGNEVNANC